MPGIAGFLTRTVPETAAATLRSMRAALSYDPRYASGQLTRPELGLHLCWTAHPDSLAASENQSRREGPRQTVLAGECYRDAPPSQSGNRVPWVAEWIATEGIETVHDLNGLFSGVMLDDTQRTVALFNDRFGVERLYVAETPEAVYFASEAKALLAVCPECREFDGEGVMEWLVYGCTLGTRTLFRGVSQLPAGSLWTWSHRERNKRRYFDPREWENQDTLTAREFDEELADLLLRIMPRYADSRQPLGVSLTGGLDTRMIMACLPALSRSPICYTFSGLTERTLDEQIAARVAAICGCEHRVLRIRPDFLGNFGEHLDRTVYVTDGCAGALTSHEIYLNRQARNLAPVRLTGNFGSEVLRSMSTFKPGRLPSDLLLPEARTKAAACAALPPQADSHPVTFSAFKEIPWSLFGSLAAGRSEVSFRTPFLDNELVRLAYRAPKHLRLSPLPSLRLIARHSPRLAEIPTDRGLKGEGRGVAHGLRRLFAEVTFKMDYLHKEGLPSALSWADPLLSAARPLGLLGLHKYLPYRRWFRNELSDYVQSVITDPQTRTLPYFDFAAVDRMVSAHRSGNGNHLREIAAVLQLESLRRQLLRAPAPASDCSQDDVASIGPKSASPAR